MATASDVLRIAQKEIGYSRWTDNQTGTKYGRWYASYTGSSYFGTNGVPFCAMFVSYVLNQAGQKCAGFPGASCSAILNAAKKAGLVRSNKKAAKAGDAVIFDWGGDGAPDHIGFVESNFGSYIQTIEGNTTGTNGKSGGVNRRTRNWSTVKAVIAIPYSGSSSSGSSTSSGKISVDGCIGNDSTRAWQTQLGCSDIDGVISGQSALDQPAIPNVYSEVIEDGGSNMVRKLQQFLNGYGYKLNVDGYLGSGTVLALQKWMRNTCGYKKHALDGILGPNTAANVQNAINAGYFK